MNPTIRLLQERKSVRAFEPRALTGAEVDAVLEAALRAPTAGNQMLYTILQIETQELKDRLAVLCDNQPFIAQAPLVLVFLADCRRWMDIYEAAGAPHRNPGPADLILAIQDAMVAAHASVVAADSLGLGSCYIGDIVEHRAEVVRCLHLDRWVFPVSLVVYGSPTEQQRLRPQPNRFDRDSLVLKDGYRRLGEAELRAMVAKRQATPDFNFDAWVKTFCERKYMADFSTEMNRSVVEYLVAFQPDAFDAKAEEWDQKAYRVRRAAEVAAKIRDRVRLGPGVRALDFGCGTGLLGFELAASVGPLTFADTSGGMLEQVTRKIADQGLSGVSTLNLTQTPVSQKYDLIFSLMVLHHIDDVPGQIMVLAGALDPGGYLCLADLDHEDGAFHAPDTVPHNGFHRRDVEGWLAAAGLEVVDTCTGFVNKKLVGTQERDFPVFLVTARRLLF